MRLSVAKCNRRRHWRLDSTSPACLTFKGENFFPALCVMMLLAISCRALTDYGAASGRGFRPLNSLRLQRYSWQLVTLRLSAGWIWFTWENRLTYDSING